MSTDKLAKIIDDAFEGRDKIGPKTKGAVRKAVDAALELLDHGEARVAEKQAGRRLAGQSVAEEGRAAVVPAQRHERDPRRPGQGGVVGQGRFQVQGLERARLPKAGFRAVPGCVVRRSAFIAPGVVLMPSFVNLGAYVDSGTMVDTWATVGSCAQIGKNCTSVRRRRHRRRARAAAGRPGDHRGQLLHRRALGSGRRRDRARGRGARHGRVSSAPRPRSSTATAARSIRAKCRPIRWWCSGTLPGKPLRTASRAEPLLRGHRQARRRDARAPRPASTNCCGIERRTPTMSADPVAIARDLLRCRSVTPAEGGALDVSRSARLKAAGFTVHRMTFSEPGADDVENLYARIGTAAPHLMFAGHTDVVPPGDEKAWAHPPFAGEEARRRALRPRRGRHEGRHRLRARRRARPSRGERRQARKARSRS